jgi:hypothetical protein
MTALSKAESWNRIVQAELSGEPLNVLSAIVDHISQHPNESLFTVEKELRKRGSVTHLFAETMEKRNLDGRMRVDYFADVRTKSPRKYGLRILSRSSPHLWQVIAQLSANRLENLERLKRDTGIPILHRPL